MAPANWSGWNVSNSSLQPTRGNRGGEERSFFFPGYVFLIRSLPKNSVHRVQVIFCIDIITLQEPHVVYAYDTKTTYHFYVVLIIYIQLHQLMPLYQWYMFQCLIFKFLPILVMWRTLLRVRQSLPTNYSSISSFVGWNLQRHFGIVVKHEDPTNSCWSKKSVYSFLMHACRSQALHLR